MLAIWYYITDTLYTQVRHTPHTRGTQMIKATNERSIDNWADIKWVMGIARGEQVTIGKGKVKWTLEAAYLSGTGGYTKERGVYPSAIARLRRKDKYGTVHYRECHLHQVRLAK